MFLKNRKKNNPAKTKDGDSGEDAKNLQRMKKVQKKDVPGNSMISQKEDSMDLINLMDLSMDHLVDLNQGKTKRLFLLIMDSKDSLDLSL